jgi:hypothetical protein
MKAIVPGATRYRLKTIHFEDSLILTTMFEWLEIYVLKSGSF